MNLAYIGFFIGGLAADCSAALLAVTAAATVDVAAIACELKNSPTSGMAGELPNSGLDKQAIDR